MRVFVVFVTLLAAFASGANATCVSPNSSSPSLSSELDRWSTSNDTTVTIKLEQGTYNISRDLDQRGPGENVCCGSGGYNAALILRGGYVPGHGCDENFRSADASLTVLDGGGSNGVFYLWFNGAMSISDLSFHNYGRSDGVTLFGLTGTDNPLQFDHVIAHANSRVDLQGSTVTIRDVLVYGQPPSAEAALQFNATDQAATATHLTVVGNGGYGLSVENQFGGNLPVSIFNSIFWANAQGDIVGYDAADNNNIKVYTSIANESTAPADFDYIPPNQLIGVFDQDPIFVDGPNADFHLYSNSPSISPAINAGTLAVAGGEPQTDIEGNPRVVGGVPDLGAYESSVSFYHTYVVTTPVDNGDNVSPTANSLRWAILSAKQSAAAQLVPLAYRITFDLPSASSCPGVMSMNSASTYPDIDFDLTIDATTQPNWKANDTLTGFDAVLCVGLNGGDAITHAFQTIVNGARVGRLSLFGMKLGGFTDAAIKLNGGKGHLIHGNQIGGVGVGALGLFGENHDGIRITGATGTSFVGAFDDPSTRNLIIDNTDVGVFIDSFIDAKTAGSYVVNNLIGLGSDGATPVPNGMGIFVNGSPRNIVQFNTIAASTGTGLTISGSNAQYNSVAYNTIGYPEAGSGAVANGTQGILVNAGASNNTIGALRTSITGGNVVASTSQGVYVSSSGGTGNLIVANTFLYTAGAPIDLGPTGTPNDLQSSPVILHAYRTKTAEWIEGTLDTSAGDAFRVDVYYNSCCDGAYHVDSYLGRDATGVTDGAGHVHFWARVPVPFIVTPLPLGSIVATATAVNGDTSKMSALVPESTDMIYRDDFGHGP